MDVVRALAIALSVTFLVWVGAVTYAATRLITHNWPLFVNWRQQPRASRVQMALWIAVPGVKLWLLWMRGVVLSTLIFNPDALAVAPFIVTQAVFVLPLVLLMVALELWWICDLAYGQQLGDRVWRGLIWGGAMAGAGALAISEWVL